MKCNANNLSVYSITEKGSLEVEPLICSLHHPKEKKKREIEEKYMQPYLWAHRILRLFTLHFFPLWASIDPMAYFVKFDFVISKTYN